MGSGLGTYGLCHVFKPVGLKTAPGEIRFGRKRETGENGRKREERGGLDLNRVLSIATREHSRFCGVLPWFLGVVATYIFLECTLDCTFFEKTGRIRLKAGGNGRKQEEAGESGRKRVKTGALGSI